MATGIAAQTWTAVSVSNFVPTTAAAILFFAGATSSGSGSQGVFVAPSNAYSTAVTTPATMAPYTVYQGASNSTIVGVSGRLMLETTNIYWAGESANNASALNCLGWEDNL
jgi:hypothetical protein